MISAYDEAVLEQPGEPDSELAQALEPAALPEFAVSLRGYDRGEVDAYIDYQRRRLAAMRLRAQRAERALAGAASDDPAEASQPPRGPHPVDAGAASPVTPASEVAPPLGPGAAERRHLHAGERPRRERLRQLARYAACSVVSIVITEALLALVYGDLRLAPAVACSMLASAVAAVPTFFLYRSWVWRLQGPSRLRAEVVPFWIVTAAGILLSTLGVAAVTAFVPQGVFHGHLARAAVVDGASVASFGVLWVARFVVLDRWVFAVARAATR